MSGAISTGDGLSMVEFNPANVDITGGSITGLTELGVGTSLADPGALIFSKDPAATNLGNTVVSSSWGGGGNTGNPYVYFGYNIDAPGWTFINSADDAAFWGIEGNYDDGSGDNKMEGYLQWQFGSGKVGDVYRRSFMSQFNKDTNLITGTQIVAGPTFGIDLNINDGTGSATEKVIGVPFMNIGAGGINTSNVSLYAKTNLAVGANAAPSALYAMNVAASFTNAEGAAALSLGATHIVTSAVTNAYGSIQAPVFNPSTAKLANPYGTYMKAYSKPQMALSTTVAHDTLTGIAASGAIYPGATLGTITNLIGFYVLAPNTEATGGTFVYTRSKGIQIENIGTPTGNAGATVGTGMGITIAEISGGSIANYGIQLGGTAIPIGGNWSILNGSANPSQFSAKVYFGGQPSAASITAKVHIAGSTTAAGSAPLKFTSGTNMSTAETGAWEYDGTTLFYTRTGTTRESVLTGVVNSVSPTLPNRTVSVVIAGTTYYLAAKTTND